MKDSPTNPDRSLVAVFDVKTLGVHTNAHIAAIGCVIMDIEIGCEIASFYARFGANDSSQGRRYKDAGVLAWWDAKKETHSLGWKELFKAPAKETLDKALVRLERFLRRETPQDCVLQIIGKGPVHDDVVLAQAYGQFGLPLPWLQKNAHQLKSMILATQWINGNSESLNAARREWTGFALNDARRDAEQLFDAIESIRELKEKAGECDTHKKNIEPLKKALTVAGESIQKQIVLMQAGMIDFNAGRGAAPGMARFHNHLSQFDQVPTAAQMASVKGCGDAWVKAVCAPAFGAKVAPVPIDENTPFDTSEASA